MPCSRRLDEFAACACFINLEIAEHIVEILFSKRLLQFEILWKRLILGKQRKEDFELGEIFVYSSI